MCGGGGWDFRGEMLSLAIQLPKKVVSFDVLGSRLFHLLLTTVKVLL